MTALFARPTSRGDVLSCGPQGGPQILVIQPLFEEANRCRRTIALFMRTLAELGIGSALPDLSGTGESGIPLSGVKLEDWHAAVTSWVEELKPAVIASFRGGALADTAQGIAGHWRFAPETGARIIRDLERTRLASATEDTELLAGHAMTPAFVEALRQASPAPLARVRTVRLETDALDADLKVAGTPLWRRAEPGEDADLAKVLACDLAEWARQCAAS